MCTTVQARTPHLLQCFNHGTILLASKSLNNTSTLIGSSVALVSPGEIYIWTLKSTSILQVTPLPSIQSRWEGQEISVRER